jgi:TP53 regulating kinase-like protein
VPGLRFIDATNGVLGIEWLNGKSIRFLLGSGDEDEEADGNKDGVVADEKPLVEYGVSKGTNFSRLTLPDANFSFGTGPGTLMMMVGKEIAKMHLADIVHGDLTTSNMMLRHPSSISDSPQGPQQLVREHASLLRPS